MTGDPEIVESVTGYILKGKMIKFSLIFPVHNEEKNLAPLVSKVDQILSQLYTKDEYEIIVVDDKSDDASYEVAEGLKSQFSNIIIQRSLKRIFHHRAIEMGFKNARACEEGIVMVMDADQQYSPEDIPGFVAKIDRGMDIVNARRINRTESFMRVRASRIFNALMRFFFKLPVYDHASTFIAIRAKFVRSVTLPRNGQRFLIPFLYYVAGAKRIAEIGVRQRERIFGKTKYRLINKIVLGFPELVFAWWNIIGKNMGKRIRVL